MGCVGASSFDGLGMRAMFSELKTRGFDLEDSQIQHADRLVLYWAVSTGMWDSFETKRLAEKTRRRAAQECRPKLDLSVQARPTPHPVLPATPQASAAFAGRLEN